FASSRTALEAKRPATEPTIVPVGEQESAGPESVTVPVEPTAIEVAIERISDDTQRLNDTARRNDAFVARPFAEIQQDLRRGERQPRVYAWAKQLGGVDAY